MVPAPVALRVTDEPCTLSPREMLPPLLACRVTRPVAISVLPAPMVIFPAEPLLVSEKLLPDDGPPSATACESTMVTLPVVLACSVPALVATAFPAPMLPAVETITSPVVPIDLPAPSLIAPAPALSETLTALAPVNPAILLFRFIAPAEVNEIASPFSPVPAAERVSEAPVVRVNVVPDD